MADEELEGQARPLAEEGEADEEGGVEGEGTPS